MPRALQSAPPSAPSLPLLAERVYASAYHALENDDDRTAERWFWLLALLAPRDERAWVGLAVTRERREEWAMAAARYLIGTALVPGSIWCNIGRARNLRRTGRFAEADQAFDEAEASTDDPEVLRLIDEERSAS